MSNKGKHLTLEERCIILNGIINNSDKASIAKTLGKSKATISLEIKKNRVKTYSCGLRLECANYKTCKYGRKCHKNCPNFVKFKCKRRDRSPGACNGCEMFQKCRFSKFKYDPNIAQTNYAHDLVKTRQGINHTENEVKEIAEIIVPLIVDNKQSPYMVLTNHPEIKISEKTLYTYIENDVFKKYGLTVMNLRRQVSRKISKKQKVIYKKRVDRKHLLGRTSKEYEIFILTNPDAIIIQMDTVYNDVSNGPFIQTFKIIDAGFMICILHDKNTSENMVKGVDILEKILSPLKGKILVLKTDRGSEFTNAEAIEYDKEGNKRFNLFYCDPMCSYQKGSLENNHEEIRYFLPKKSDFQKKGLTSQEKLNVISSNINSFPKERLKGKTPFQTLKFYYPELIPTIKEFGINEIDADKVILDSSALKD